LIAVFIGIYGEA